MAPKLTIYIIMVSDHYNGSDCKESACNAGDPDSVPGSERCPGEGNGNPIQYSCLENPMDRGPWKATVHGVTKSQALLNGSTFMVSDQFILICPAFSNFGSESFTSQELL